MAYDLSHIRNRVINDKLDDPTYDSGVVDNFINDTQREIFNSAELPFTEKVFSGQVPVDEYIFQFPLDYQVAQALVITDPQDQKRDIMKYYMGFREFNRAYPVPSQNDSGVPLAWTSHGNKMYFSRPTDQQYQLDLSYNKSPIKLEADADVPEVPEAFEEALVLGAYWRVLERNEDFDLAAFIRNGDYQDQLDLMAQRLGKRQSGKPNRMGQPLRGAVGRRQRV